MDVQGISSQRLGILQAHTRMSLNRAVVLLLFLRKATLTFLSAATICTPITGECTPSPYPHQHLLLPFQWQQVWVRRDLREVSICITQMAKDVEHFLKYLLAICSSPPKTSCALACVLIGCFGGLHVQFLKYPLLNPVRCVLGKDNPPPPILQLVTSCW